MRLRFSVLLDKSSKTIFKIHFLIGIILFIILSDKRKISSNAIHINNPMPKFPKIKFKKIFIKTNALFIFISLFLILFFVSLYPLLKKYKQKQIDQKEIKAIHELVQRAIETGEKEPLITISADGFSQEEIKIKTDSFISFYNSTDQEISLESEALEKPITIQPKVTSSIRFNQETEIKIGDKGLKVVVE